MTKKIHLDDHSVNQKYFSGIWRNKCTGHKSFCEYILDYNGTFVDKAFEKAENIRSSYKGNREKMFEDFFIIHFRFMQPNIELIDAKYTTLDLFANFGGNFGIFAEITGCSFLVLLNLFILMFKILFRNKQKSK